MKVILCDICRNNEASKKIKIKEKRYCKYEEFWTIGWDKKTYVVVVIIK